VIATPDLIESLVQNLTPVRRLRPPLFRAACWLGLATIVLVLIAISQGLRPDLAQRLEEFGFVVEMLGSLLTGISSAVTAFMLSLPDRSRFWFLLPALPLAAWLSTVGYQCLYNWVSFDANGLMLGETARCFATLALTSLPLSLAMLVMLRQAAPLRPTAVTLAGSLAVAAMTASALSLFHAFDATLMILLWNLGTIVLVVGVGGILGRRIFGRVSPLSSA
jgi:hypothetical protein